MYFRDSLSWSKSALEQARFQPATCFAPTQSLSDGETVQRAKQKINGYKTEITELEKKKKNPVTFCSLSHLDQFAVGSGKHQQLPLPCCTRTQLRHVDWSEVGAVLRPLASALQISWQLLLSCAFSLTLLSFTAFPSCLP